MSDRNEGAPPERGAATAEATQRGSRRPIVAATIGNFVEWYDYTVYGTLVVVLATLFFPKEDPTAGILLTFTGFAVSSLMRPGGAILFGALGDRIGRRATLSAVILLMSGSTAAIGLLPTYADIGVWAPILLFVLRALQGVSAGGEYGGSASFLAEYAPEGKRGLYTSWQTFSVLVAFLVGALLGALLTRGLGPDVLMAWGWRVPFLVALPFGLIGLYLRLKLEETPAFAKLAQQGEVTKTPLREATTEHLAALWRVGSIAIFGTVATFVFFTYSATYVVQTLKKSLDLGLIGLSIGLVIGLVLCPFVGIAADRWGRRPVMLGSTIACLVLTYPGFLLMNTGSDFAVIAALVLFVILVTLYTGAAPAVLTEAFPTRVRYSGLSIGYSIAASLAGLLTPFVMQWFIGGMGQVVGPTVWVVAVGILGLLAAIRMPETRDQALT